MMTLNLARFSLRVALIAVLVAVCNAQTGAANAWGSAAKSPEIFATSDLIETGALQSILLIGENHASVKTQMQLADLLEKLYREQAIDAILVEGSNGRIDASDLRDSLAKAGAKRTAEFWRGQLDLGQIAGYEYVALTRDGVRIWGVEDMDAKRRYTADAARRGAQSGLQDQIDLHRRAVGLAKDTIAPLDPGVRAGVDAAVRSYEAKIAGLVALKKTDGSRYAEAEAAYSDSIERITALYGKLRPVLPAYDQVVKEAQPYNKLLERARRLSAGGTPSGNEDPAKLLTDLRAAKSRVEKASANFDAAAKKAGYADAEAVVTDLKQIQDAEDMIKSNTETINELGGKFGKLEGELTDQFFVVANSVRSATGRPIPALQSFLRDERERARANSTDPEKPYLSDRDQYMVTNTLAFLQSRPDVKRVALIIGYAHLEGMTKRLREKNVNILAGKVAASEEETEQWENRAWQRRSRPALQIFSGTGRKELSRLLDETYKQEIPALLSRLERVSAGSSAGLALGKTKTFESGTAPGSRKAIVLTPDGGSLRADWGSHVVDLGTLPDGSGTYYLVVDRDRAQQEVKKLSSATTIFATAYRTKDAQGAVVTNFDLPEATEGMSAFKSRVPGRDQTALKRVVIATEGDARALNTALGSGGAGQPPWTSRVARFADPPEGRRPILFFTKNMRRANERLNAMDKQDPLRIGQIASFEMAFDKEERQAGLGDLWFTPEAGDHARAYLIAGDNTPAFRQKLKEAADAGLLRNKQIALATCFDPKETEALRDMLLEGGALMVWSPENRISPEAARKLKVYMEKVDGTSGGRPVRGLDEYVDRALKLWYDESKDDPELKQFLNSTNTAEVRADMRVSESAE